MKITLDLAVFLTGFTLAVIGLWFVWPPLAPLVGGGILMAVSVFGGGRAP